MHGHSGIGVLFDSQAIIMPARIGELPPTDSDRSPASTTGSNPKILRRSSFVDLAAMPFGTAVAPGLAKLPE
jgi:hypothetical protein